jgi:hypothetical protein
MFKLSRQVNKPVDAKELGYTYLGSGLFRRIHIRGFPLRLAGAFIFVMSFAFGFPTSDQL